MAVRKDLLYPGRWNPSDADYPLGGPKNRTTPSSQDGSYFDNAWIKDYESFFGRLMTESGVTANEASDTATTSQFFEALSSVIQGIANDRIVEVTPLDNSWNGFLDPNHQALLPSTAGYPSTSVSGGTVYGLDDEWSYGHYSSAASNNISSDDDGVIFSIGIYQTFNFSSEQLSYIDINTVPVYIVDNLGVEHFVDNSTSGVSITKPDSTTLKVELSNSIFAELGISKVWRFFVTEKKGRVPELSASSLINRMQVEFESKRAYQSVARSIGVLYTSPAYENIELKAKITSISNNSIGDIYVSINGSATIPVATCGGSAVNQSLSTGTVTIPRGSTYILSASAIGAFGVWELR